jgi:hypothetical protein
MGHLTGLNGVNGANGHAVVRDSQLSAAVPEFSPAAASNGSDSESKAAVEGSKDAVSSSKGKGTEGISGEAPLTNGSHEESQPVQPYTNGVASEGH